MGTMTVKDGLGANQTVALVPNTHNGSAVSSAATPVAVALDDAIMGATNAAAPASDTAAASLNGRLQRVAQNISSLIAAVSATNTQLPATPSGSAITTITRPANVTPYTAGDVLGGAIQITTGMTSGQRVMIAGMDLMPQIAAIPAGMTSFRLYLYNVTPPSAIADNSPWTFASGDRASFLGYVDVGSPALIGATLFCQLDQINKMIQMAGSANIFGYLVTNGGFTPAANSEVYQLRTQLLGL